MNVNANLIIIKTTHSAKNVHQNAKLVLLFLCASHVIILHKEHLIMAYVFVMINSIQQHQVLNNVLPVTTLAKLA